ncbi:lipopolysaccharide heptosyltransferase II [Mesorhizobium sp. VK24D]|uniref:lipopolysaccharide heptosyltransferase II n=1 Tax=Mesorhizobium album TaxID=3072314 RepID=A0ABU4XVD8_9HYPH|nr:lipopolysaccharide heptosyltransferase II [Mesorhizobium sp. VK24D]MDX8478665.1 lipopolysaccharide heptosyltransferase II [Mesorhizobium sp. VK24D]
MNPILVVSFPAIGDFIRSHSAIQLVAERFPGSPIDVITSPVAAPLASLMPHVRKGWVLDKKPGWQGLVDRYRLGRELRGQNYQAAYLLTSATKAAIAPRVAGIPKRIGYPREFQFGLVNRFPADWWRQLLNLGWGHLRLYDEVCDIATLAREPAPVDGWPAPQLIIPPSQMENWRRRSGLDLSKPVLALYTSGLDDVRKWPIERFSAIAADYANRGWSIWIIGAAREQSAAAKIRAALPEVVDLTSTPLLMDAMCQIAASTLFLGVDGGPSHAAAALNVPCLLIFRANRSYDGGPVNRHVRFIEPPISTPGRIEGTFGVSVEQVLAALATMTSQPSSQMV